MRGERVQPGPDRAERVESAECAKGLARARHMEDGAAPARQQFCAEKSGAGTGDVDPGLKQRIAFGHDAEDRDSPVGHQTIGDLKDHEHREDQPPGEHAARFAIVNPADFPANTSLLP